jgi:hypothetical protein
MRFPRAFACGDPRERVAQGIRVEGIEQKDDQVTAWIRARAGVGVDEAHAATADIEAAQVREVLLRRLVEGGRDLDADNAFERRAHREKDGATEPASDIDERRASDRLLGYEREHRFEVRDRHRFVVGRVSRRFADVLGVEFSQKEQRFGHDAVGCVEAPARFSSAHATILP